MAERTTVRPGPGPEPPVTSLTGFYWVVMAATALGILVVFVLNLATPFNFVLGQIAGVKQKGGLDAVLELAKRVLALLAIITGSCAIVALVMRPILKPIAHGLIPIRQGREPAPELLEKARRRLLNLPFICIAVNLGVWILLPAVIFLGAHLLGHMGLRPACVLSARASMVGFISSGIAFFAVESHCRRRFIPLFFPQGRLTKVAGAARMSMSRRIRMFYRLGSLVPMTILVVTLVTLQWEVDSAHTSAETYGQGILIFALVLFGLFFLTTGMINRMVTRSVVRPLEEMLGVVGKAETGDYSARIRVVSNDEIGVLGDAGNDMLKGLAEREHLRSAFGRYVTPEIRDEILSGRIPLNGERREATVMFADLRNFTPFVESNSPEDVIAGMRSYFTAMHGAIRRHRGLVLQFVGDEIEAVFGVPVTFEDHADAALRAAIDMRTALDALNRERDAAGEPPFSHGVGIHSGRVLAGNTGSEEQSAYALIGNTVNVASRIQGLTRELGCDILASQGTVALLKGDYPMEGQPPCRIKGYSKSITVYRILGASP